MILPTNDNGLGLEVKEDAMVTFNGSYFVTNNLAVELLAALPFTHEIDDRASGANIGKTKHLPPTLSVQWHFNPNGAYRPYVGLGVNYTLFFEEEIAGADLTLDDSIGVAGQIGLDIQLSDRLFANVDFRYIDIETDAKVNGTKLGTVKIDPYVVGLSLGVRL